MYFDSDDPFKDHMVPVYVLIIYFGAFTVLGFAVSFYSEFVFQRTKNKSMNIRGLRFIAWWFDHLGEWRIYYFSFVWHVMDEATNIAWLLCMYYICCDRNGSDISSWPLLSREPTPEMLFLVSFIVWALYKVGSLLNMLFIDIFLWYQMMLHLFDSNYLYEMHIAHSTGSKNPV